MSTPAIRAIEPLLTLPLLVALAGRANDHHPAVPADDLALLTHGLDARANFHECLLLVAIGDPTSLEVVRGDLDLDSIAREDADAVHAHLSGAVGQHLMAVLQLDTEHGVGKGLDDDPLEHDRIFLGLCQVWFLQTTVSEQQLRRAAPIMCTILPGSFPGSARVQPRDGPAVNTSARGAAGPTPDYPCAFRRRPG